MFRISQLLALTVDEWVKLAGLVPGYGALVLAIWGVRKWRLELVGKADFDLARRCLMAVYTARNAIADVRHEAGGADMGGPYPIQAIYGEQGSCKSTAQKMQRALVDPNKSPLRSEPKSRAT